MPSWPLLSFVVLIFLAYVGAALSIWALAFALLLIFACVLGGAGGFFIFAMSFGLLFAGLLLCLPLRRRLFSKSLLNIYRELMPPMSRTEKEALNAGTVAWEGEIFGGKPDWDKLLAIPSPKLSAEEEAFIAGPVETLCRMIDDWQITHELIDLPPEVWAYLKTEGFFALSIPKIYGGKQFSNYALSQIQVKVQAYSVTAGTTVSVPNSLGPAELLFHYGTPQQKAYYLPRLARCEEIPCFALTSPDAGSDATSMTDWGQVCRGNFEGQEILGIKLNFNKRYITLAPIATVIGLAFKLYDPDLLLEGKEDLGITCALIPRATPGVTIGRRHFPLNTSFQNGPIQGKDVFIPLDWVIGGQAMVGQGWRMLMECLAGGRAVSLPAVTIGSALGAVRMTGAYARIRRQFKQSIGRFEGISEVLGRMGGNLYLINAARVFTLSILDRGEKPAVASAILKYHVTEHSRQIGMDAMDIQGGKGIILGPKNYLGRGYQSAPIAITVEGANILTRNLIIFGQGAMRCHPYVYKEFQAARDKDEVQGLKDFDKAFFAHIGFGISNLVRSLVLSLTGGYLAKAPKGKTQRYFQQATRFSAAFALLTDVSMGVYGGSLKRRESVSARLGDIVSYLYLISAVLNRYHLEGCPEDDLPLVRWTCETQFFKIQNTFRELIQNLPSRPVAWLMKVLIFPWGHRFKAPKLSLSHQIAQLFMAPTPSRERLTGIIMMTGANPSLISQWEAALTLAIEAEPFEKLVRKAHVAGEVQGRMVAEQMQSAVEKGVLSAEQFELCQRAEAARQAVIAVDDFANADLVRTYATQE